MECFEFLWYTVKKPRKGEHFDMYDGASFIENKLELRFFGSGARLFPDACAFDGARLPYELFLSVTRGTLKLAVKESEILLSEGEAALVPFDEDFHIQTESDTGLIWAAADYRVFTNLRVFSLFDLPRKLEDPDAFAILQELYRLTLDSEFTNYRMENALETNLILYRLALLVVRKSYPKKESNMLMSRFERLSPVLSHIGEKLDRLCPVGELSEIMGLSEDAFYRYFKSTIGLAPKEYLISERLRLARILLAGGNTSVTDIASACGYDNPFYFSTLFHGKYGFSPSAYREKIATLMLYLNQ